MVGQILLPNPQAGPSAPEVQAVPAVADTSPGERANARYAEVIAELVVDAAKSNMLRVLVNVMTYNLACLIIEYGSAAAGDVLERLGSHIWYLTERNRATREAKEAQKDGKLPH